MPEDSNVIKKTAIGEYLNEIGRYVDSFEVKSGKDEQALSDILAMLKGISTKIDAIEVAHRKRVQLTQELEARLAELESVHKEFVVKSKPEPFSQ